MGQRNHAFISAHLMRAGVVSHTTTDSRNKSPSVIDLICLSTPSSTAHKDKDGTRNRVMNSLVACDTNALFSSMAQLEWKWPKFSTVYRCRTSDLLCN